MRGIVNQGHSRILYISTVLYLGMLTLALGLSVFGHGNLAEIFRLRITASEITQALPILEFFGFGSGWSDSLSVDGAGVKVLSPYFSFFYFAVIGILAALFLLLLSFGFESSLPSFRSLKEAMLFVLGPIPIPGLIYLAFLSSFAEEFLFRGALQPTLGLVFTSLLFALAHIGPKGRISAWTFWAFIAGLVLGWIFEQTGHLAPVVLGHFFVNLFSLTRIRLAYLDRKNEEISSNHSHQNSLSRGPSSP